MALPTQNEIPQEDEKDRLSQVRKGRASDTSVIKTWTRLAIGAVIYGMDMMSERARDWGEKRRGSQAVIEDGMSVIIPEEMGEADRHAHSHSIGRENKGVNALVGILFDTQNHITKNLSTLRRVQRLADRITYPVMRGMRSQPLLRPFYRRFDRFVRRGQYEIGRWEEIGKIEEGRSRELLKTATLSTFDSSIDYLSTNPDIQDLVQVQSTTLLNDLIEEVRERAVSVNTILEGWVRKTFGLIPRSEIPGPPPEIRRRAELFHTTNKRIV